MSLYFQVTQDVQYQQHVHTSSVKVGSSLKTEEDIQSATSNLTGDKSQLKTSNL